MTRRLGVFGASLVVCLLAISSLEGQQTQFLRVGISVERNSVVLTATRNGRAALDSGGTIVGFVWP